MYVLTDINDNVILGPMEWNPRLFNSVIEDDFELIVSLRPSDRALVPLLLHNSIKIRHARITKEDITNSKLQRHQGPTWIFDENEGIAHWYVENKPIELVKHELKELVTAERYIKETSGFVTTIQEQEVFIDTMRGSRDIFFQKLLFMGDEDTVNWKFPNVWLTLNKMELGTIVSLGALHIQNSFDWEVAKLLEIDNCTTLEELDAIIIHEE